MNFDPHPRNRREEDQDMNDPRMRTAAAAAANVGSGRGRPQSTGGATGLRGQCWWLMRELNTFTINRLLETYATGEECNPHINLRGYLFRLEEFGVVERLQRRQPGDALSSHGFVVWRLKRNLGILAPVWRRQQKVLWDPNRCEIVMLITSDAPPQSGPVLPSEPESHD